MIIDLEIIKSCNMSKLKQYIADHYEGHWTTLHRNLDFVDDAGNILIRHFGGLYRNLSPEVLQIALMTDEEFYQWDKASKESKKK